MGGEVGAKRIGRAPSQVLRGVGLRKLKQLTEENHGGKNQCDADQLGQSCSRLSATYEKVDELRVCELRENARE